MSDPLAVTDVAEQAYGVNHAHKARMRTAPAVVLRLVDHTKAVIVGSAGE